MLLNYNSLYVSWKMEAFKIFRRVILVYKKLIRNLFWQKHLTYEVSYSLQKELTLREKGINFIFFIAKTYRLLSIRIIKHLFLSDCNGNRTHNHLVRKRTLSFSQPFSS